jgi:hypothetical protein
MPRNNSDNAVASSLKEKLAPKSISEKRRELQYASNAKGNPLNNRRCLKVCVVEKTVSFFENSL